MFAGGGKNYSYATASVSGVKVTCLPGAHFTAVFPKALFLVLYSFHVYHSSRGGGARAIPVSYPDTLFRYSLFRHNRNPAMFTVQRHLHLSAPTTQVVSVVDIPRVMLTRIGPSRTRISVTESLQSELVTTIYVAVASPDVDHQHALVLLHSHAFV